MKALFIIFGALVIYNNEAKHLEANKLRDLLNELQSDVSEIKKSIHDQNIKRTPPILNGGNGGAKIPKLDEIDEIISPPEVQYNKNNENVHKFDGGNGGAKIPKLDEIDEIISPPEVQYDKNNENVPKFDEVKDEPTLAELSDQENKDSFKGLTENEINIRTGYFGDEMKIVPGAQKRGVKLNLPLWGGDGRVDIPYEIDSSVKFKPNHDREIKEAIEEMNGILSEGNCKGGKWIPKKETDRQYIRFQSSQNGCWSYVGRVSLYFRTPQPDQPINIGNGCQYKGIVLHEMLHAMGFSHEQSRSDRDNYVEIKRENIIQGYESNFDKLGKFMMDASNKSPYDYNSIMHYGSLDFSKDRRNNLKTIVPSKNRNGPTEFGQRIGLTKIDKEELWAVYKCKSDAATTKQPDTTTKQPDTTTKQPDTTTKQPDTTTKQPDTTTKQPDTTTGQPDTTTKQPDTTTEQPETTTEQPETTTEQPETTTEQPETTTEKVRKVIACFQCDNIKFRTKGFRRTYENGCKYRRGSNCTGAFSLDSFGRRPSRELGIKEIIKVSDICENGESEDKYFCAEVSYTRKTYSPIPRLYNQIGNRLEGVLKQPLRATCGEYKAKRVALHLIARPNYEYFSHFPRNRYYRLLRRFGRKGLHIDDFKLYNGSCSDE